MTGQESVPPVKERRRSKKRVAMGATAACALVAIGGTGLWQWQQVDRTPFTGILVGLQDGKYAVPGSTPGSCVRTAASEEETVVFDDEGKKLAAGRAEREGALLGREFGDCAGHCLIVTRIDHVPGGHGTYVTRWGGGTQRTVEERDLRRSAEAQREDLKTAKNPTD
ncbi:hypothetical protein AB0G73_18895 [Streptomyces sp. NPDC020719]|uniref:hypothetical protein n=1 Tax=Streptomyces sp. NPDC020719 TaxID=3154896 RepID=UPI0033D33F66